MSSHGQHYSHEVKLEVDPAWNIVNVTDSRNEMTHLVTRSIPELFPGLNLSDLLGEVPTGSNGRRMPGVRVVSEELQCVAHLIFEKKIENGIRLRLRKAPLDLVESWKKNLPPRGEVLKQILDHTRDICIILSPIFEVHYFNQTARELLSHWYQRDLKVGEDFWQYLLAGTEKNFLKDFNQALNGRVIRRPQKKLTFPIQESRWFESTFFPVRDEEKRIFGIAVMYHDIDKVKLLQAERDLQRKTLMDISYHQSHLIRSHVANLMGLSELLQEEDVNLPGKIGELVSMVKGEAQRLDAVIHAITNEIHS